MTMHLSCTASATCSPPRGRCFHPQRLPPARRCTPHPSNPNGPWPPCRDHTRSRQAQLRRTTGTPRRLQRRRRHHRESTRIQMRAKTASVGRDAAGSKQRSTNRQGPGSPEVAASSCRASNTLAGIREAHSRGGQERCNSPGGINLAHVCNLSTPAVQPTTTTNRPIIRRPTGPRCMM